MYNFILQIIIMFSLGVMIYLIARASPRIGDIEVADESYHNKLDRIISRLPLDEIDVVISTAVEKFLRKSRLFLMKWDNTLSNHLKKIKKTNGNGLRKEDKPSLFEDDQSLEEK